MYTVLFTPKAQKDLTKLPTNIRQRIIKKITFFAKQDKPLLFSKTLVSLPPATHRFRVGDYRIAFFIEAKRIHIDRIRHRSEVYAS